MNPSSNPLSRIQTMAAPAAIVLWMAIGLVMLTGCRSLYVAEPVSPVESGHPVMRVAHRGGAGIAPENTLAAFAAGLSQDIDALEMDVHLSKDGVLMVMHDPLLKRTTGQPGEIGDYDAATLSGFDAAVAFTGPTSYGRQAIPTLEQVLDLVAERADRPIVLQIEIKLKNDGSRYPQLEEKLVQTLREHAMVASSIIISFDFPSLVRIQELEPSLKTGALISKKYFSSIGVGGPKAVANEMAALGVDYAAVNYTYLTASLYRELRSRSLGVGVWTVNDPDTMRRLAALGVDFITSDRPDVLGQVFASKI